MYTHSQAFNLSIKKPPFSGGFLIELLKCLKGVGLTYGIEVGISALCIF